MTTERQHTLTGCARCGNGDRPGHMVPVGDERLCVGCAGAEIERLRETLQVVIYNEITKDAQAERERHNKAVAEARDALGKEQP